MNDEIKIGTKIKTLVDFPDMGIVKKNELGIVFEINTSSYNVNFPSQNRYKITKPLNKTKYEVLSEEFSNIPQYGRWYKALVNNPKSIPYLKKGDYAKSDGKTSFLEFSNGNRNVNWSCSEFKNDIWELMPEGFEPETTITNTFGLKIGNTLPKEIINKWCSQGLNYYGYTKKWESQSLFSTDRVILSFKLLDGILGFEVSNTANVYLKAEGFKEFMDNFNKKENNKFEVGKWYELQASHIFNKNWYLKLKKVTDTSYIGEYVNVLFPEYNKEGKFDKTFNYSLNELTDLSEIQPYLPEGHPDKINTIPEYVECIVSKHTTMFTVGKIYNFPNPVDNEGEKREVTLKGSIWEFKPSTKEAYDAQENSKIKDMEKSEFKKGEYIVLIDTPLILDSYPKNYIFKQRETNNYFVSVLDNNGSKTNGWSSIEYLSKYWRYATPEEITEYERLGKPYDVTTLNKSNIKELTSLPKHWYITVTEDNQKIVSEWKKHELPVGSITGIYEWNSGIDNKEWNLTLGEGWKNEITFEQFKKWVLKENSSVTTLQELPEKWAIKPSKNSYHERNVVRDWFNTFRNIDKKYDKGNEEFFYWHYPAHDNKINFCNWNLQESYVEIPFELFEKHYLNKSQLPPHLAAANIEDEGPDFSNYKIGYDPIKKETKKHTITDIPTTQPIVIKLNKKINYLIPKSI